METEEEAPAPRREMLVPLVPPADGEPPSWVIIELQGEIERKDGGSLEDGFEAGEIQELPDGKLKLQIGYHLLDGKRVTLAKPFLVLQKGPREGAAPAAGEQGQGEEGQAQAPAEEGSGSGEDMEEEGPLLAPVEYKIVAIVREKMLFTSRPKAIISAPTKPEPKAAAGAAGST